MSQIHVLCNNESLITNNIFYGNLLNSPCHPIPSATYLDHFLGENTDALNIDCPIAYDIILSYKNKMNTSSVTFIKNQRIPLLELLINV